MTVSTPNLRKLQRKSFREHTEEQNIVFPKVYGYAHTNIECLIHTVKKLYLSIGMVSTNPPVKYISHLYRRGEQVNQPQNKNLFSSNQVVPVSLSYTSLQPSRFI